MVVQTPDKGTWWQNGRTFDQQFARCPELRCGPPGYQQRQEEELDGDVVEDDVHKGLSIYYVIRNGGWDFPIYYNIIGGGLPNLLQYYIGGVFKVYFNITVLKGKWNNIILF